MAISQRIKERRQDVGLTQAGLARAVGASREAVSMWENGNVKRIRPNNLISCARALECNLEWLVKGVGSPSDPPEYYSRLEDRDGSVLRHINHKWLEQAIIQLNDELPDWIKLTPKRQSQLLRAFYEDIADAIKGSDKT